MSVQNAAQHQSQFAKDMAGQFSNSISPDKFIEKYLRKRSDRGPLPVLEFPDEAVTDKSLWADIINESGLCSHLKFFCTKDADAGSPFMDGQKRRPDGAAFPKMTAAAEKKLVDSNFETLFSDAPLLIECKLRTQDGFRATPDDYIGVEKHMDTSEHVPGQLITYAMHQHHQQPRVSSYQVLLVDKQARLIRFDCAGIVCTHLFDWMSGTILAEFLSLFDNADRATRGYDPTVTPATSSQIKDATEAFIKAGHDKTHAVRGPFYKYAVPVTNIEPALPASGAATASTTPGDKRKGKAQMRYFIAGCPITWSPSLTGRAGTGYICYDILEKGVHFMKDAWRINDPSLLAEYQVYAKLGERRLDSEGTETSVPHVPQLLCGGDLFLANGDPQRTFTSSLDATKRVQQYTHFRMVLKEVGKPLSSFKDIPELLRVLRDIVLAHQCALKRGILHRDISAGNILIVRERDAAGNEKVRGLLIDWDLCYVQGHSQSDEKRRITGTWQFMSIALLSRRKDHRHNDKDDLESILWVLCYCLVRYTNLYNGTDKSAVGCLNTYFDLAHPAQSQREDRPEAMVGGEAKKPLLDDLNKGRGSLLPVKHMPKGLYHLLSGLAKSLSRFLEHRDAHQIVAKYEKNSLQADEYDVFQLEEARGDALAADAKLNAWPKFTHDSFQTFLDTAIKALDTVPPSPTVAASMKVADRLKAHLEVERAREKAEQERARSMRKKALAAIEQSNGAGVKSDSGRNKRSHPDDSDGTPQIPRRQKSARIGSSHHEPSEPTVEEESEVEE